MIREDQKFLNITLILIDIALIILSLILAWLIRFKTAILGQGINLGFTYYFEFLLIIIPVYVISYYLFGLYYPSRAKKGTLAESVDIFKANFIGLLVVVTLLFIIDASNFSRYLLALYAVFTTTLSLVGRFIIRKSLKFLRNQGFDIKYLLVLGAGSLGRKFACKIEESQLGYEIVGFLDDNYEKGHKINNSQVIGKIDDLENIILTHSFDRVIIALSSTNYALLENVVDTCEKHGVKADVIPDFYKYYQSRPYFDMIDDIPIIKLRHVPLENTFNNFYKRVFDVSVSIACLIIVSPIMLATAILVKLSSPGPIIYKQERMGLNRESFYMYKFRSMKVQDEDDEKEQWTTKDDPRITRFGSFIRKTSIDELPQFFNVIKGDMSLIGPRPERPFFVEKFRQEVPQYMIKHHVRPGMSGWAQVNGFRGDTPIDKRIEFDIYYVENWTLTLDVKIFFKTLKYIFTDKNAY